MSQYNYTTYRQLKNELKCVRALNYECVDSDKKEIAFFYDVLKILQRGANVDLTELQTEDIKKTLKRLGVVEFTEYTANKNINVSDDLNEMSQSKTGEYPAFLLSYMVYGARDAFIYGSWIIRDNIMPKQWLDTNRETFQEVINAFLAPIQE